ncbi:MAG: hypothetical protein PWP60_642 [Candidatus Atribacteria bacterium]|uniref:FAD-dependent oxidoreductase n=1 Tax=Thermatribacter velox TaxID=3039681 RepID=A0ABZ2YF55_9BACT|nr:hypothetical protein [Candidatus Atribacteria bacterium]MDI3530793.1 hypothetical protein [Candidatus Atribacteria bacterium]
MAAALSAWENGARRVFLLERGEELGGILNQCIHSGFGLHKFGEELTGPEYAERFAQALKRTGVEVLLETPVLRLSPDRRVTAVQRGGIFEFRPRSVFLSMGCRERTRGMINIPGGRPAGVFTAGLAQYLVNVEGYLPGKRFVIVGSGDIGLIMARRLTLEGAKVEAVVEIRPTLSGLVRNYVQCLLDFDIPLLLSHAVSYIYGEERVEGVVVCEVDSKGQFIKGTEEAIPCDTVLLSVGLIPENELSRQAGIPLCERSGGPYIDERFATMREGFFACGNVVAVFDLVDYVTLVGEIAGKHWKESEKRTPRFRLLPGEGIQIVLPHYLCNPRQGMLFIRAYRALNKAHLLFSFKGKVFYTFPVPVCRPSEMLRLESRRIPWPEEGGEITVEITGEEIQGLS